MYSIVARRSLSIPEFTQGLAPDLAFRVAFLHAHADAVPLIPVIPQRSVAARGALDNDSRNTIELARVRSASFDRYRDTLNREHVPHVSVSVDEFLRQRQPGQPWVVVLDPDELTLAQLAALSELQATEKSDDAHVRFIAMCAGEASPARLCRLFKVGAYLSKKDVSVSVFWRQCQLAARGDQAPLTRFSEQAGFSGAEQHAFFAECAGLSKCEAADELGCSPRTLETYWSRIFAKLRIRSTDGVVAAALRFAMLDSSAAEA